MLPSLWHNNIANNNYGSNKKRSKSTKVVAPAKKIVNDEAKALESISVLEFMRDNAFTQFNKNVGKNVNDYPFVTFITEENKAENVYFSIGASATVDPDTDVVDAKFLNKFVVVETTNADGETRIKLARKGGNRGSIAELIEFETL